MKFTKHILAVILSIISVASWGEQLRFYSPESTMLSNSLINHIYQDTYGYIWVSTEDGLNRFDGVDFKVYHSSLDNPNSLCSNYVHLVFEDTRSRLWVGSLKGLQRYDRATETFVTAPMISFQGDTITAHVMGIVEDREGNVWVATSGQGMMVLCEDGCLRHSQILGALDNIPFITSVSIDREGFMWVVAFKEGVYRCNVKTGEVMLVRLPNGAQINETAFVRHSNDGRVLINIVPDGIYQYDQETGRFELSSITPPGVSSLVYDFASDDQYYYVGTDGQGLVVHNILTSHAEVMNLFIPNLDFSKAKVHSILIDREQNIWLGLFQKGIVMIPRKSSRFVTFSYNHSGKYNIGSGSVMSVKSLRKDEAWVGVDSDGLYHISMDGESTHITAPGVPRTIMDILEEKKSGVSTGNLVLSSYNEGLVVYNTKTQRVTSLNDPLQMAHNKYNRRTSSMVYDNLGRLWVGSFGCGVFMLNSDYTQAKSYSSSNERIDYTRNEPINNWTNCLCAVGMKIWMGTYRGICCFDTSVDAFVNIPDELRHVVKERIVYDINVDRNNKCLWIATNDGLFRYLYSAKYCRRITEEDGLSGNTVVSVLPDSLGRAWVGTYSGLSCVAIKADSVMVNNYYYHNGLQGNEYSRCATSVDPNGRLFFGGTGGVTAFIPTQVHPKPVNLNVMFSYLVVGGRQVTALNESAGEPILTEPVASAKSITFSEAENSFSLGLTTMNFVNPEQVRYDYYLEKVGEAVDTPQWQSTSQGDKRISYTNISHGEYILHVRARMSAVVSADRTLSLVVRPMWWRTNWAILLYLILLLSIVYAILKMVRQRRIIKEQLDEQLHQQSIDEAKFQFFFNISHEIRTPLTLIINPVNELLNDDTLKPQYKTSLSTVSRNAQRILRLINQLLDMRRIEKGQMELSIQHTNIVDMFEQIIASFESIANTKKVNVEFFHSLSDSWADVDVFNFDKVAYNLLSNAFKFVTNGTGHIIVRMTDVPESDMVQIDISDNGIGIAPEERESIFERFYQVSGQNVAKYVGTGIGLHLTRSIVTLHGGTIEALDNQEEGVETGTTFRVRIPRSHPEALSAPVVKEDDEAAEVESANANARDAEVGIAPDLLLDRDSSGPQYYSTATSGKHLLIVDDEPEILRYLQSHFKNRYRITTASDGKEAMDLLLNGENAYDMVITDVMMPNMDGLELCYKIKHNLRINYIPVILLTAKHSDADRNQGLLTGADAYIAKPFDIEMLKSTIQSILANRERILQSFAQSARDRAKVKKVELRSTDDTLMEKVTEFIEANISDPTLNVDKLAEIVSISRVHMHRKLKELTGQSAREYILSVRLRQAAILLAEKKLNISEVAYALGFSNLSHFSTAFKKAYGISPKDYKVKH
ncbi:MAG: two-component regulator propeller domain-containing protein [Bacteroidia bacterium]|nr:two-component regulator propeller domain-containing protein [Bacteroidia bacterium]